MAQKVERLAGRSVWNRIGSPPVPHEHGAWVILYVSLIVGFGAAKVFAPILWLTLSVTVTGVFLSREAIGLLIRRRGKEGTSIWAVFYVLLAVGSGIPLL